MSHPYPDWISKYWELVTFVTWFMPFCVYDSQTVEGDPPYGALYDLYVTHRRSYKCPMTHPISGWISKLSRNQQNLFFGSSLGHAGLYGPQTMKLSTLLSLHRSSTSVDIWPKEGHAVSNDQCHFSFSFVDRFFK